MLGHIQHTTSTPSSSAFADGFEHLSHVLNPSTFKVVIVDFIQVHDESYCSDAPYALRIHHARHDPACGVGRHGFSKVQRKTSADRPIATCKVLARATWRNSGRT